MAGETDMDTHVQTYGGVITLLKWGGLTAILIAFAVILWIAR